MIRPTRAPDEAPSSTLYHWARFFVLGICRVAFRVQVEGREHVPTSGAYIVAPTHRSLFDIPFSAEVSTRRTRYLAKQELFRIAPLAKLFRALGAIEVERGAADRAALRALEASLLAGEPVCMFPEGTRGTGGTVLPLFDGTAYLAVKLGVPIVPVGIGGSEQILPKGKRIPRLQRVHVVVGEPVLPDAQAGPRRAAASRTTAALQDELQRAFTEACRAAGTEA